jgi:hypothetical protein
VLQVNDRRQAVPDFIIRGTIAFPFEARVSADAASTDFDLFTHFGVAERFFGASAWEDYGPLSDPYYGVTIDDANSSVVIDSVEPSES